MKAYFEMLSAAVGLSAACVFAPAWGREPVPVILQNGGEIAGLIAQAQGSQQPFGVTLSCKFNAFEQCSVAEPVPPSQRLVIEFVSARCETNASSPNVDGAYLQTSVAPNGFGLHFLRLQTQGPTTVVSELVKVYADPGTAVTFIVGAFSQNGDCLISLSGQQVSVP